MWKWFLLAAFFVIAVLVFIRLSSIRYRNRPVIGLFTRVVISLFFPVIGFFVILLSSVAIVLVVGLIVLFLILLLVLFLFAKPKIYYSRRRRLL
ncbi:MAG: hypothetical protein ABIH63_01875 [archaeon]